MLSLAGCNTGGGGTADSAVPWRGDLNGAIAEARAANKPVFVDFYASWCGPCQQMEHGTWPEPSVGAAMKAGFIPVHIDVDQHQDFASQYHVESIPTYLIIDGSGEVRQRGGGYMPPADFLVWLNGK